MDVFTIRCSRALSAFVHMMNYSEDVTTGKMLPRESPDWFIVVTTCIIAAFALLMWAVYIVF